MENPYCVLEVLLEIDRLLRGTSSIKEIAIQAGPALDESLGDILRDLQWVVL